MARAYRKKPVTVEAVQWTGENRAEVCEFIDSEVFEIIPRVGLVIHTLEGDHHASPGDYIIKGVNGEFYPCKPDIFAKTYESSTLTPPNKARMINADKLAKRIAGHSNYHGDSILAAIYCATEGKENDAPIRPIENPPNEPLTPEQLREMDGEPVWVTPLGFWALVIAKPGERVRLMSNDGETVWADKEIELVGPVYRRPPVGFILYEQKRQRKDPDWFMGGRLAGGRGGRKMNIPQEFEDIFRGIALTEGEIRTLTWITGWERRTVENLRSAIQKVRDFRDEDT